jgi:hypothetical protein
MATLLSRFLHVAVIGMFVALLAFLLLSPTETWYTCSKCGNEIYITERLTWRGRARLVRCLTARRITAECKHPANPRVVPTAPNPDATTESN